VIPRYKQPPQHLKGPAPREWLLDIYPGDGARSLRIGEPGYLVEITYRCENGTGRLEVSPAPITLAVRLVERHPAFLRAAAGVLQPGEGQVTFIIDAAQGASVEFRD
jgi:hypothetical protein